MPLSPVPNKFRQVPIYDPKSHGATIDGATGRLIGYGPIGEPTGYKLQQLHRAVGEKPGNEVVEEWRDVPIHTEAAPCNPSSTGL